MQNEHASRREFLAAAAGAAVPSAADGPAAGGGEAFEAVKPPEWVRGVTRMAFGTPGEVERAARAGVEVFHTNVVWPYFPLRRDGGGLAAEDARRLRELVADCHRRGIKLGLGLPPFPPAALVRAHPDWRVHPDDTGAALRVVATEDNLGTRLGCNLGPWGDYLVAVCAELVRDYGVDGFSFDGNYHPALCFCPACKAAYRKDRGRALPPRADLDDVAYREYLVWRGGRLEVHYRRLQRAIKASNPDAVLTSWTVNAGRYGHFLFSPRAMPTRLNRLFDLPMQEWWHDETNLGASVAPAFGAAYLRAVAGDRPCASEPYLMARGNPYGSDSFPAHERLTRALLNLTHGGVGAESFGWPGHAASAERVFREIRRRAEWLPRAEPLRWAALLVGEQTRQFYAYRDIAGRFLPHAFGAFRAALEEHLPLTLVSDWDLDATLARYAVLVLPNAAALSDAQVAAVRAFVRAGGGLVATGTTSLCDELGRPREDFALADVFGVSYRGRPAPAGDRPALDENFAAVLGEDYWKRRVGVATLTWGDHPVWRDARLRDLVPGKSVNFRGPLVRVSEPAANEAAVRMTLEGKGQASLPAVVLRRFGAGRVAYFAAGVDAALWSYAYPYQRRLLAAALEWAARGPAPAAVAAPLCVQAAYYTQPSGEGRRVVVHLFNGVNTAAGHGLPAEEVPLREETLPVHGIKVRFRGGAPAAFRWEPEGRILAAKGAGDVTEVEVPPLEIHGMVVGEG